MKIDFPTVPTLKNDQSELEVEAVGGQGDDHLRP
jgi:hypothetical protein